jgi:hypothetical protein
MCLSFIASSKFISSGRLFRSVGWQRLPFAHTRCLFAGQPSALVRPRGGAIAAVLLTSRHSDGEQYMLTKGDNNQADDRKGVYERDQMYIRRQDIMGTVRAYLPYVGMLTILMNDYPRLKWACLGILGLIAVFQDDD